VVATGVRISIINAVEFIPVVVGATRISRIRGGGDGESPAYCFDGRVVPPWGKNGGAPGARYYIIHQIRPAKSTEADLKDSPVASWRQGYAREELFGGGLFVPRFTLMRVI
jgi:hypothetical protein